MRFTIVAITSLLLFATAAPVLAQEQGEASPSKADAATSLVEFEAVMSNAGCEPQAIKDPKFVADAKNAIRPLIHEEDARAMLTNKKHVVMAYAALLALLVLFVVLLAMRQQRLGAEIQRLSDDLESALKDE